MWVLDDVEVESDVQRGNPLTTTGGHVWDAAKRLAEYFEAEEDKLDLKRPGVKILELGAGCGWLGLAMARNLPQATVCMTEMAYGGALEHLVHNIELNRSRHNFENVLVADCDWSHWGMPSGEKDTEPSQPRTVSHDVSARDDGLKEVVTENEGTKHAGVDEVVLTTTWDFIIGSDLVYNEIGVEWLPKVMAGLLKKGGVIYYCHTKHRMDMADQDFLANLAALGLSCTEVRETGTETPPPSPPFFESLFPEQRIAIWKISSTSQQNIEFCRELYVPPEEDTGGS